MDTMLLDSPHPVIPDIDDDLTRRRLLSGIGALGLTVTLAGCASGEDADRAAPVPTASASGGPPVRISHKYGVTEIAARPQRVVTVGYVEQDPLLALGVVPVATTEWFGAHPGAIHPWARDALGAAAPPQVLEGFDGLDLERVAGLGPDLILALIGADVAEADYERLSRIAPTVVQPAGVDAFGMSWQEITRTVGRAVFQAERAEQLIADLEARFAAVRAAHPEFAEAIATVAAPAEDGNFYAYPPPDAGGRLLADLGFRVPAEIAGQLTPGTAYVDISQERLDLLDLDALVWLVTAAQRDQLLANELYTRLAVAREGRDVLLVDEQDVLYGAASSFQGVLSLPLLLDRLPARLAAALDGDPATTADSPADPSPAAASSATPTS